MRVCNAVFNDRRIFDPSIVYRLSFRLYRAYAAAREEKLRGLRACVYCDVYTVADFRRFEIFRPTSVYYVFRVASACERVATQNEDQHVGGVRAQSIVVRRYHVRDLAVCV